MPTAAKEGTFSASSDPCVLFPLAASSTVNLKTRVWGSREKTPPCFSATVPLSGNSRRGWENSSGKTAAGSALDANGNTTSKTDSTGTTNYFWDFENRLSSVTLPGSGGSVSYAYDPFGRRIRKISSSGTSIFSYDGDNLVEETNSGGSVVARYSQGPDVDEPLAMLRSGTTSYYQADGLGSITSLSNTAGALAQTYTFDSFGNQTASSGSLTNSFRYTAREFDSETALYFMRARYFDPATGRFINEDPAGFDAGSPNFYAYVANDPIDGIDPFGLKCIRKMILVTAYSDSGPGKDWPYFAPKKRGGKPGSVGPGTVAVANTNPPPYPFGSGVTVSNNPDPFGSDNPLAGPAYGGSVHDTGAGWDPNHNNVSPGDWIDIWLPHKQAIKWGKQWRWVTICTPDNGCSSGSSPFKLGDYGIDNPYRNLPSAPFSF